MCIRVEFEFICQEYLFTYAYSHLLRDGFLRYVYLIQNRWCPEFFTYAYVGGLQDRVVSRRVVLADVPLYRNFLQKVFPCSASLAEESYDFSYS